MLENTSLYANLASKSYEYSRENVNPNDPPVIDGYKIIYTSTPGLDGFQAVAYAKEGTFNSETGKYSDIVIAYTGSVPLPTGNIVDFMQDWINNDIYHIGQGLEPPQYTSAKSFYDYINQKYAQNPSSIELTGHSLGGALAQLVGSHTGSNTVTFNAPGVQEVAKNNSSEFLYSSNITNYSLINDFMGNYNTHIGQTYYIEPFVHNALELLTLAPHADYTNVTESQYIEKKELNWSFEKSLSVFLLDKNFPKAEIDKILISTAITNPLMGLFVGLSSEAIMTKLEESLKSAIDTINTEIGAPTQILQYKTPQGEYIFGTDEAQTTTTAITGTNDFMWFLGGNDIIYANAGNDTINGKSGNDIIIGGQGNDTINGGDDNDIIIADYSNATISELQNIKNTIPSDQILQSWETLGTPSNNTNYLKCA